VAAGFFAMFAAPFGDFQTRRSGCKAFLTASTARVLIQKGLNLGATRAAGQLDAWLPLEGAPGNRNVGPKFS
jgi:hypothetical protein